MPGHTQPVVSALFSTDGSRLATAAGDCTVGRRGGRMGWDQVLNSSSSAGTPVGSLYGDSSPRDEGALQVRVGAVVGAGCVREVGFG